MPVVSDVLIANLALSHIGDKSRIESLSEKTNQARECRLWYDFTRQEVLEAHDWTHARKRADLALDGDAPPDEWNFRYKLPVDCVAPRLIINPLDPQGRRHPPVPYSLETNSAAVKTLLCNLENATLRYTFDQKQTASFTPVFVVTFSRLLAHHICFALTGKRDLTDEQLQIYQGLIRSAPALDANEERDSRPPEAPWIVGR